MLVYYFIPYHSAVMQIAWARQGYIVRADVVRGWPWGKSWLLFFWAPKVAWQKTEYRGSAATTKEALPVGRNSYQKKKMFLKFEILRY